MQLLSHEFLCGGASSPNSKNPIRLDVQGAQRNVNLSIGDISRAMLSAVPDVLLDLLEIAAYIYCADQQTKRGTDLLTDHGSRWRRQMSFTIPVRLPDIWESAEVAEALCETLAFLSDDYYSFAFVPAIEPFAERERYFAELGDRLFEPDDIALFSGGVDSFAGVAADVVGNCRRLCLVGHYSATKVGKVQKELVRRLKLEGLGRQIFYVPVNICNANNEPKEFTQRTRSFLFACLGLVVAQMFRREGFTFFENGVVSLNIPIAKDIIGARATRTTHPRVINGFERLFSAVLDREIRIETPFQWQTKKEVVQLIGESGLGHLLGATVSCAHPRTWTTDMSHCGQCSQCIDRRSAILAAGMEGHDPADKYGVDLLLGDRSQEPSLRLANAYVKFFRNFASMDRTRFVSEHPEIAAALGHLKPMSPDEAEARIFDLYRRHAADVSAVLEDASRHNLAKLLHGQIPAGTLLSMSFNRSALRPPAVCHYDNEVKQMLDRLPLQPCEFAVDDIDSRILFKGDYALTGTNYRIVHALISGFRSGKRTGSGVPFMKARDLARELKIDDASLRKQMKRLRDEVAQKLAVGQGILLGEDGFIENVPWQGYRLNPSLREVFRVDLGACA